MKFLFFSVKPIKRKWKMFEHDQARSSAQARKKNALNSDQTTIIIYMRCQDCEGWMIWNNDKTRKKATTYIENAVSTT